MISWMTCMGNKPKPYECLSPELRSALPFPVMLSWFFIGFPIRWIG